MLKISEMKSRNNRKNGMHSNPQICYRFCEFTKIGQLPSAFKRGEYSQVFCLVALFSMEQDFGAPYLVSSKKSSISPKSRRIIGVRRDSISQHLGKWIDDSHLPKNQTHCSQVKRSNSVPTQENYQSEFVFNSTNFTQETRPRATISRNNVTFRGLCSQQPKRRYSIGTQRNSGRIYLRRNPREPFNSFSRFRNTPVLRSGNLLRNCSPPQSQITDCFNVTSPFPFTTNAPIIQSDVYDNNGFYNSRSNDSNDIPTQSLIQQNTSGFPRWPTQINHYSLLSEDRCSMYCGVQSSSSCLDNDT